MSNEFTHQFTHSTAERRESIVYGSTGKGGLFIPKDFLENRPVFGDDDDEDNADNETTPLIDTRVVNRKQSIVEREILANEREILEDAGTHVQNSADSESIRRAFEQAVGEGKVPLNSKTSELRHLVKSSVPLVLTFLLQNSLSTVSVLSVGHLGANELAAVSLGAMTANITGYATIQGISTALDTLCPQAFGAKKYHLVGFYLQKCTALIFTIVVPILLVWIFWGEQLIRLMVPDPDTAVLAAKYLVCIAPGIPAYILFECGKRFLQAQGVYHISTYVLFVAAPLNAFMNFYLVSVMGYYGAPIAVAINYWIMAIGLYIGTVYGVKAENTPAGIHPLSCWDGLDLKKAFSGWDKLLGLAIPGLIMLEAEFLAFEILTLIASYLGTVKLAAQSVGATMASLTYQVPFAIGIAASTRIANYLGAGLPNHAKRSVEVALSFGLVISSINCIVLFAFETPIAKLFTSDERVIEAIQDVMWLVALMQVFDAMNANSAGCLRGQGQTKIGGIVNLVSYYLIGIPLSIYICFYSPSKGSLNGLWIGSCVSLFIIGAVQSYYSIFADFQKLCEDARNRNNVSAV